MKTFKDLQNEILSFIEENHRIPVTSDFKTSNLLSSKTTYGRIASGLNPVIISLGLSTSKQSKGQQIIYDKDCKHCRSTYKTNKEKSSYCSVSCSNKARNRTPANKKFCSECNTNHDRNSKYCSSICKMIYNMKKTTIHDLLRYKEQNLYRAIRDKAFYFYKFYGRSKECQNCGYSKYTETCHITPIKNFYPHQSVWECNKPENILFLCPNCYWEFDYGDLTLEEIKNRMQLSTN